MFDEPSEILNQQSKCLVNPTKEELGTAFQDSAITYGLPTKHHRSRHVHSQKALQELAQNPADDFFNLDFPLFEPDLPTLTPDSFTHDDYNNLDLVDFDFASTIDSDPLFNFVHPSSSSSSTSFDELAIILDTPSTTTTTTPTTLHHASAPAMFGCAEKFHPEKSIRHSFTPSSDTGLAFSGTYPITHPI